MSAEGKCQHVTCDNSTRFPHWNQCSRKAVVDVEGYGLCRQHENRARTYGFMDVVTGEQRIRGGWGSTGVDFKQVTVARGDAQQAKLAEGERAAERRRAYDSLSQNVTKFRKIIAFITTEYVIDDPDVLALQDEHPSDIDEAIACVKAKAR